MRSGRLAFFLLTLLLPLTSCAPPLPELVEGTRLPVRDLWGAASGVLSNRMVRASPPGEYGHTVYRTVWKHPEGERLVCFQYPGAELFGTPYNVYVLDRALNVMRRGETCARQDCTPYCIAEVKTSDEEFGTEALRGKWLLAVAFWKTPFFLRAHPLDPAFAEECAEARQEGERPYVFYFEAIRWEDAVQPRYGSGNFNRVKRLEVRWIEPEPLDVGSVRFEPGKTVVLPANSVEVRRGFLERRIPRLLASERTSEVWEGLALIPQYGMESAEAAAEAAGLVAGLLGQRSPRIRRFSGTELIRLKGRGAASHLRPLLADRDISTGIFAAVALCIFRDGQSIPGINRVCERASGNWEVTRLIWAMEDWGDPGLLPGLISLLESDGDTYTFGDWDFIVGHERFPRGVRADAYARRVLRAWTGCEFPPDVRRSRRIWARASKLPEGARQEFLSRHLGPAAGDRTAPP